MPRPVAVYISGHGYGHLSQIAPVLNRLADLRPDTHLLLRTDLPEALVARRIRAPFTLIPGPVDVGVVQKNAISEDIPATIKAARTFYTGFEERIKQEANLLAPHWPAVVLSDIAPVAFPMAKRLGIPSIAVASLDWHDIYRSYLPEGDPLLTALAQAHAACDLLIQPPLSMPMRSFTHRKLVDVIVDDAYTGKKRSNNNQKTALVMFGGAGDPPFNLDALGTVDKWQFLYLSFGLNPQSWPLATNVRQISSQGSTAALMHDCDIVVTKPGYGTLAECWQTGTPLAYAPREDFPEYPYLDAWLQGHAPACRMDMADFVSGNWASALQAALDCPRSYPRITASGAEQAAELITRSLPLP